MVATAVNELKVKIAFAGIFVENKFRKGNSSFSKFEGGQNLSHLKFTYHKI